MLTTKYIKSQISYIEQIAYQNEKEMSMLQHQLLQMQPIIFEYISKKMSTIKQITQLTINYLHQLNQVKDQNLVLKQNNQTLHENINELSNITQKLQNQIQKFQYEIHLQREQLKEVQKRQSMLEIQRSMMRKQMKNMKQKLQQDKQHKIIKIKQSQLFQNQFSQSYEKQDNKFCPLNSTMDNNQRKTQDEKLKNIQKQVHQLKQQSIFLKKKVSQSSTLSTKPIILTPLHEKIHLQCNKQNQQSNTFLLQTRNYDKSKTMNNPNTLQQQLRNLKLKSCKSLTQEDQQDLILTDICRDDSFQYQNKCQVIKISSKKGNQNLLVTLDALKTSKKAGKIINKLSSTCSNCSISSINSVNQQLVKTKQPFLNKFISTIKNTHNYLFHKIVIDRIQPRRTINKYKNKHKCMIPNKNHKVHFE